MTQCLTWGTACLALPGFLWKKSVVASQLPKQQVVIQLAYAVCIVAVQACITNDTSQCTANMPYMKTASDVTKLHVYKLQAILHACT